jgi:hypothetical protein
VGGEPHGQEAAYAFKRTAIIQELGDLRPEDAEELAMLVVLTLEAGVTMEEHQVLFAEEVEFRVFDNLGDQHVGDIPWVTALVSPLDLADQIHEIPVLDIHLFNAGVEGIGPLDDGHGFLAMQRG